LLSVLISIITSIIKEVKREDEKEKLIISEEEGEGEREGQHLKKKKRQTMILRHESSKSLRFWQTPRFLVFKNVIKIVWYTILKHSYKISLTGLYFICLTSVNLINAGYSKSLFKI
jgi:hypothetical protein